MKKRQVALFHCGAVKKEDLQETMNNRLMVVVHRRVGQKKISQLRSFFGHRLFVKNELTAHFCCEWEY